MKKTVPILICSLLLIYNLSGCGSTVPTSPSNDFNATEAEGTKVHTENDVPQAEISREPESMTSAEEAEPDAAVDPRSTQGIILFFCQAVLGQETPEASPATIHKWTGPISYFCDSNINEENLAFFTELASVLQDIPGLPEIDRVDSPEDANLCFHFCTRAELFAAVGESILYEESNGAVQLIYEADGSIRSSHIWIRTDLSHSEQESLILLCVVKSLGIPYTSDLWPEGAVYSGNSSPRNLSEADILLLKILYDERIRCGMDSDACADVIRACYP